MPIKRDAIVKPQSRERAAVLDELNEMLERAGMGPRALAADRARIVELVNLDRDLESGEQKELDKLVAEYHKRRRTSRAFEQRSVEARHRWAEKSVNAAFVAKWEQKAIEGAKRHDHNLERPRLSGQELHWLYYTARLKRDLRRQAKRDARDDVELEAEDAALETRRRGANGADGGATAPRGALPPFVEPPDHSDVAPARRRKQVGIVATYALDGTRIS